MSFGGERENDLKNIDDEISRDALVVVSGPPEVMAAVKASRTAPYLSNELAGKQTARAVRSTSKD